MYFAPFTALRDVAWNDPLLYIVSAVAGALIAAAFWTVRFIFIDSQEVKEAKEQVLGVTQEFLEAWYCKPKDLPGMMDIDYFLEKVMDNIDKKKGQERAKDSVRHEFKRVLFSQMMKCKKVITLTELREEVLPMMIPKVQIISDPVTKIVSRAKVYFKPTENILPMARVELEKVLDHDTGSEAWVVTYCREDLETKPSELTGSGE
eukprot:TRINITY_DN7360_c0_g1_i2.p1 TRINITY_DN7360_c0_g1~~TRINITY_DN7360_c0_g1_i2.p1  ORF type:complete len:205 (+),score=24.85 TRINITY_DN7360_c0_g1_i2:292-906(+)